MKHTALFLFSFLLVAPFTAQGQKLVDKRDQATGWYTPVNFKVAAQTGKLKTLDVKVYKDNKLVETLTDSKTKFTLNLDLDNYYTVVLIKEDYRTKSIFLDTHIPEDLVRYPGYFCAMNLEPDQYYDHSDPFYLDFPSAIVRWDNSAQGFAPQIGYLDDIQSKMAMLQVQMDPH